jgi:hypothetical protein
MTEFAKASVMSRISALLFVICFLVGSTARAQSTDLQEYVRLASAAQGLLDLIESASEAQLPGLREAAIAADLALVDWLDAFFLTPDFAALSTEDQAAAYSDRYRWEHNLSVQLLALGRCQEARDRIRSLLERNFNDPELRPVLRQAYEGAVLCIAQSPESQLSALHVEVDPVGADVVIDDVLAGPAPLDTQLTTGEHVVVIRAQGYEAQSHTVVAQGTALALGPIVLEPVPTVSRPVSSGPQVEHWVLWGTGVAGIGSGLALYLAARDREDVVESPPDGYFVTDPDKEEDLISTFDAFAITAFGVGIAAAVAGTILYLTQDDDVGDSDAVSLGWFHDGRATGLWLGVDL